MVGGGGRSVGGGDEGGGWGGMKGGAEGDRGWDDFSALTDVEHMCGQHTNLAFFGGWAVGRGVFWPRKRSIWIAIALENFAARPCPSLCDFRKAASISSFEHVSEKKGTPSPRPRQRSRPRFSDPSFLLQPCSYLSTGMLMVLNKYLTCQPYMRNRLWLCQYSGSCR